MIFAVQPDSFNCLLASIPLRIGMEISVTMTSGASRLAASNRDWPSGTLPTTSQVDASRRSTITRNCRWSSAKSIRTLSNGSGFRMRSVKIPVALFQGGVSKVSFFHATDPSTR
jgi:hypothetical protein